jgi:hypothetical protein
MPLRMAYERRLRVPVVVAHEFCPALGAVRTRPAIRLYRRLVVHRVTVRAACVDDVPLPVPTTDATSPTGLPIMEPIPAARPESSTIRGSSEGTTNMCCQRSCGSGGENKHRHRHNNGLPLSHELPPSRVAGRHGTTVHGPGVAPFSALRILARSRLPVMSPEEPTSHITGDISHRSSASRRAAPPRNRP